MEDGRDVKLRNLDGVWMSLTELLLGYLVRRGKVLARFALGDWLATLSSEDLLHLISLADIYLDSEAGDSRIDDLGGIALIGSEAERNRDIAWTRKILNTVWDSVTSCEPDRFHDLVGRVFWAASLEKYRRLDFVRFKGKIRIHPFPNDQGTLTDKGLTHGISIRNTLH